MVKSLLVVVLAICSFTFGTEALGQAESVGKFRVGLWTGYVWHRTDGDRGFSHCTVQFQDHSGTVFLLGRSDLGYRIILANDEWSLPGGAKYQVTLVIEPGWRAPQTGQVLPDNRGLLIIELGHDGRTIGAIGRGRNLHIETPNSVLRFPLDGSARAIKRLDSCFEQRARPTYSEPSKNPFTARASSKDSSNPFAPRTPKTFESVSGSGKTTADDLKKYAKWTPKFIQVYQPLITALDAAVNLFEIDNALAEGTIAPSFAEGKKTEFLLKIATSLSAFDNTVGDVPSPKFQSKFLNGVWRENIDFMKEFRLQVANIAVDARDLYEAVVVGDAARILALSIRQFDAYAGVLEAQNRMLAVQTFMRKPGHPQSFFERTIIASNRALIELFRGQKKAMTSSEGIVPRGVLVSASDVLNSATEIIADGRKAALEFQRDFKDFKTEAKTNAGIQILVDALRTYDASFDVEEEIVEVLRGAVDGLINGDESGYEGLILLEALESQRTQLVRERDGMIGELGDALAPN